MAKHGKKYNAVAPKVDRLKNYEPAEAVALVKECAFAQFNESIDVHMNTNIDPRQADQLIRGTVSLPAGTGKVVRILAFCEGDAARIAEEAGADYVGIDEYLQKIQDGWFEFDVVIAVPQAMGKIGRLGRVLGPRGLMPTPKAGTVVQEDNIADTIQQLRQGRVEYRVDRTGNLHIPVGRSAFTEEQLMDNLTAVMRAVVAARPASVKGNYIKRLTITSTMGPGIRIDIAAASAL